MILESFLAFLSKIFCFTAFVNANGSFPGPLTPEEEKEYLIKCKEGDLNAREMLIRHNLRLVAHIVKKYSSAGEADDLISIGTIGLIKGVETFEYGRGSQLATYVARCIDNEILMYIRANKKRKNDISLGESVGTDKDGNEITLMEIIPSDDDKIFTRVENAMIIEKIEAFVKKELPEREREVIEMRYGLNGREAMTQLEVAARMNISRSYVSRIEKKAIKKISQAIV